MLPHGRCQHIDASGQPLYAAEFHDLGVYHKGIATARDAQGWFHIDLAGRPLYAERYALLEPFYNGVALATSLEGEKCIVTLGREAGHATRG